MSHKRSGRTARLERQKRALARLEEHYERYVKNGNTVWAAEEAAKIKALKRNMG